ncbi:MAG: ParB N-terminal domain-containing protein [Spirochaetales bacterium]|nr:ParB N-terminal domain-containing protein [Spirochaetales bacterium]
MRLRISEIKTGNRIRRELGDLGELENSLQRLGLLNPLLIDPDNNLLAGYRRLTAAKNLGWDAIEVRLIEVDSPEARLIIESEENTVRKNFTPGELERLERLLERHQRKGFLWNILNWILDLVDRLFRR